MSYQFLLPPGELVSSDGLPQESQGDPRVKGQQPKAMVVVDHDVPHSSCQRWLGWYLRRLGGRGKGGWRGGGAFSEWGGLSDTNEKVRKPSIPFSTVVELTNWLSSAEPTVHTINNAQLTWCGTHNL